MTQTMAIKGRFPRFVVAPIAVILTGTDNASPLQIDQLLGG